MANVNEETRLREELAEARKRSDRTHDWYEHQLARATAAESALAEARGALEAGRAVLNAAIVYRKAYAGSGPADYEKVQLAERTLIYAARRASLLPAALARAGEQGVLVVCDHAPNEPHQKDGAMPGRVSRHLCLHPRAGEQAPLPEKQLSGSAGPGCGACAEESKEGMPSGSLHGAGEQEVPAVDWNHEQWRDPEIRAHVFEQAMDDACEALRVAMHTIECTSLYPPGHAFAGRELVWHQLAVDALAARDALKSFGPTPPAGEPASSGQEVVGGSRRFGKTESLKQAALEAVARNPDAVIAWASPRAGPDQPWHAPATPPPGEQGKGGVEGRKVSVPIDLLRDLNGIALKWWGYAQTKYLDEGGIEWAGEMCAGQTYALASAILRKAALATAQPAAHHGDAITRARAEGAAEMRERCALALEHPALSGDLPFPEAADVVREVPLPEEQPAQMVTCSTDTEEHHGPHRLRHPTRDEKSWCLDPVPAEHPAKEK